jgi:hypothetical protein
MTRPIAEMKVKELPKGPLYWRIENFPTLDKAKAAASVYRWNPDTVSYDGLPSLTAEVAGKAWLFTLGPQGTATPGGNKVAEIGPVPSMSAPEYLLRVNYGSGPAGAKTPVHSHFGSEAFYVIAGKLGQKTPNGISYVEAGHTMNGHIAGMTMQVFNAGATELPICAGVGYLIERCRTLATRYTRRRLLSFILTPSCAKLSSCRLASA